MTVSRPLIASVCIVALAACGGGGGGESSVPAASGQGGASPPPPPPPPAQGPSILDLLPVGSELTYRWSEARTEASGGSGSASTDYGVFKVVVTGTTQVGGSNGILIEQVAMIGDAPIQTRFGALAIDEDGSLVGIDGGGFQVDVVDINNSINTAGFFSEFASDTGLVADLGRTFSGAYNELSGVGYVQSKSDGGCEVIFGQSFCEDSQTSFSEAELFSDDLVPLSLTRSVGQLSSNPNGIGGSSSSTRLDIELIDFSSNGSQFAIDGFEPAPWTPLANAQRARIDAKMAAIGGDLFAFGGFNSETTLISQIEQYSIATDTWVDIGSLHPSITDVISATAVDNQIILFAETASGPVQPFVYTPATSMFDVRAPLLVNGVTLGDNEGKAAINTSFGVAVLIAEDTTAEDLAIYGYLPVTDQTLVFNLGGASSVLDIFQDIDCAVSVFGQTLFTRVQVLQQDGATTFQTFQLGSFDLVSESWNEVPNVPGLSVEFQSFCSSVSTPLGIFSLGGVDANGAALDSKLAVVGNEAPETIPEPLTPRDQAAIAGIGNDVFILGGQSNPASAMTDGVRLERLSLIGD